MSESGLSGDQTGVGGGWLDWLACRLWVVSGMVGREECGLRVRCTGAGDQNVVATATGGGLTAVLVLDARCLRRLVPIGGGHGSGRVMPTRVVGNQLGKVELGAFVRVGIGGSVQVVHQSGGGGKETIAGTEIKSYG